MGRIHLTVWLLVLLLVACATSRRNLPLAVDRVGTEVRQYPGSVLRGPEATREMPRPEDFLSVAVEFFALERIPPDILHPITERLELVVESGEGSLFLPAPRFTQGSRLDSGEEALQALRAAIYEGAAGRFGEIGHASGVIAKGTTADLRVFNRDIVNRPYFTEPVRENVFIGVTLADDGTRFLVAVGVRRITKPEPPLPTAGLGPEGQPQTLSETEAATQDTVRREAAVISLPVEAGAASVAVVVPAPFLHTDGQAVAALVTISAPPETESPAHAAHLEHLKQFREERAEINAAREGEKLEIPVRSQLWTGLKSAFAGLKQRERRRSALAYLGRSTGAFLAEDVALAASDDALHRIVDRALAKIGEEPERPDATTLGLALERACYEVAFEFLRSRDAPPGLEGIILRHTGEVGRHLAILSEFVENARTLPELRKRIIEENIIFLEDTSPASRVRAYDWLTQFGNAPPGYDPLGTRAERRKAMNRYLESLSTEPLGGTSKNGKAQPAGKDGGR